MGNLVLPGGRPVAPTINPVLHAPLQCPCGSAHFVARQGAAFFVERAPPSGLLSQPMQFWACKLCGTEANFVGMAEAAVAR